MGEDSDARVGYDIIGDVHGESDKLVRLLELMGYSQRHGSWRHDTRTVVFVGDLIDRGPGQLEAFAIAQSMVEAGAAQVIVGNHEFNAISVAPNLSPRQHARLCSSTARPTELVSPVRPGRRVTALP